MLKRIIGFTAAWMLIAQMGASAAAEDVKAAMVNTMDVIVDDGAVIASSYVIDGFTYFKLRDIAYIMQDKACKFSAGYDAETRSIVLQRGGAYTPDGLELQPVVYGKRPAAPSDMEVLVDGTVTYMQAFLIDHYAYYKLRDLGDALGFTVQFSSEAGVIEVDTGTRAEKPFVPGKTAIAGEAVATAKQMARYSLGKNPFPQLPYCTMEELAQMFLDEGRLEGIRGDIAFVQALKETGYFRYGGIVQPFQNNYAGIGALNSNAVGQAAAFPDPQTGVQAQIQHLKAYATTTSLYNPCVDPRFSFVTRGIAPYVEWLGAADNPAGMGWAVPGAGYGASVMQMLDAMLAQ